jgi:hypothetical protein
MTIDTERLREVAAELGFWPATTDEADINARGRAGGEKKGLSP